MHQGGSRQERADGRWKMEEGNKGGGLEERARHKDPKDLLRRIFQPEAQPLSKEALHVNSEGQQ